MKISKIKIKNLFGITQLELDGKPIELRGAKGTGKTSVIDAIKFALTNRSERDLIIKDGADEGEIFIETNTGLEIERIKRQNKSDSLTLKQNGTKLTSPQGILNQIFITMQLNPFEFVNLSKEEQNRRILDLIEFEWDINWIKEQFGEIPSWVDYTQHILKVLNDIQSKNGEYYKTRENVNREELYKRQQIKDMEDSFPINYDLEYWRNYSLAEKIKKLQTDKEKNNTIERAIAFIENSNSKIKGFEAEKEISINAYKKEIDIEKESLIKSIEKLKAEIKINEEKLKNLGEKLKDKEAIAESEYQKNIAKITNDLELAKEYSKKPIIETSTLETEIENAEQMKTLISEFESMLKMKADCKELKSESEYMTEQIEKARTLPGTILQNCQLPIKGLEVKDGIPLINGLPISNLSNGEKIDLCVNIAIAKPNKLDILLLDGAEQLDEKSRNELYKACKDKGLQIIATRTTNDDEFNIVEL